MGVARRTLGIALLLLTVFLWTLSNFLASVSYPGCAVASRMPQFEFMSKGETD